VTALIVDRFVPASAAPDDLAAWSAIFSTGQSEASGGTVDAAALAERLRAEADPQARYLAARRSVTGPIVGVAALHPQPQDARVGFLRLFVTPAERRAGVGAALLERAFLDAAAAGLGKIQSTVIAGSPGETFARNRSGLHVLLRLERQEQRFDATVLRRCRDLAKRPHPGYRLAPWRGAAPEPLAASFGRVMGHVLDAPGAMFQMAAREWDAAEVREWEASMTAGGRHLLVCAAVDKASGEAVAGTAASVPASGGPIADQHDTAVLPDHRGRGLAAWIKAAHALSLHEGFPEVSAVAVTVNQQNRQMIAVNQALGYKLVSERLLVELPVSR
jgi:GNAT superfamily N-acetyltransferase